MTKRWHASGVALTLLALAACTDSATDAGPRPVLDLRQVTNVHEGPCDRPPLRGDGPGRACDLPGKHTDELGRSLGRVTVTRATSGFPNPGAGRAVVATLDPAGRERFAKVSREIFSLGRQVPLAILLDGRVVIAPSIQEPITSGKIQFHLASRRHHRFLARELNAAPEYVPDPPDRGPDIPSLSPAERREVRQACVSAQARLAPGMSSPNFVFNHPLTAGEAADFARDGVGAQSPEYWDRQPPDNRVYVCNYQGRLTGPPKIACPRGEKPAVPGPARALTFLVDERGNGTLLGVPPGRPTSNLCTP